MMRNRFAAAAAISLLLLAIRPARAQWSEEMKAYFANLAGERLAKSPYGQALWGLCVMDLASGETLYSEGGDKLFMPASNRKLFVSAFALDVLGGEYRFRTTLEYSGAVAPDGVLNGDLVVRASGDPSISGRFRSDSSATAILREWARQTKAKGIGAVAGDLVVDASCFDPATRMGEGWSWEYESSYYAAPSGALSFNENTVLVCVSPGSASGERCRIELGPKADCIGIDNQTSTSSSSRGTIVVELERGSYVIKVRGSMRRGAGTDYNSISVVDPSLCAGSAL